MSSSSLSISSPEDTTPPSPTLIIKLKVSSTLLRDFPHSPVLAHSPVPTPMLTPSKPASVADDEKMQLGATSPTTAVSPVPTPSVASPAPTGPGSPPNLEGKAVNGVVEAVKRGGKRAGGGGGKPGPKKRKLDDGTAMPPSRLGPKSSAGAINAGLRALDRSGAPCKKWAKSPLALKSFTGFHFSVRVYESSKTDPNNSENSTDALNIQTPTIEGLSGVSGLTPNVSMSDAASVASGASNDVAVDFGTPKENTTGLEPMEDVRSSNGDEKEKSHSVDSTPNGTNGIHHSTSEGMLVAPV